MVQACAGMGCEVGVLPALRPVAGSLGSRPCGPGWQPGQWAGGQAPGRGRFRAAVYAQLLCYRCGSGALAREVRARSPRTHVPPFLPPKKRQGRQSLFACASSYAAAMACVCDTSGSRLRPLVQWPWPEPAACCSHLASCLAVCEGGGPCALPSPASVRRGAALEMLGTWLLCMQASCVGGLMAAA